MKNFLYGLLATVLMLPVVTFAGDGGIAGGETTDSAIGSFLGNVLNFINSVVIPFILAIGFLVFVWGIFKYFIPRGRRIGRCPPGSRTWPAGKGRVKGPSASRTAPAGSFPRRSGRWRGRARRSPSAWRRWTPTGRPYRFRKVVVERAVWSEVWADPAGK